MCGLNGHFDLQRNGLTSGMGACVADATVDCDANETAR